MKWPRQWTDTECNSKLVINCTKKNIQQHVWPLRTPAEQQQDLNQKALINKMSTKLMNCSQTPFAFDLGQSSELRHLFSSSFSKYCYQVLLWRKAFPLNLHIYLFEIGCSQSVVHSTIFQTFPCWPWQTSTENVFSAEWFKTIGDNI